MILIKHIRIVVAITLIILVGVVTIFSQTKKIEDKELASLLINQSKEDFYISKNPEIGNLKRIVYVSKVLEGNSDSNDFEEFTKRKYLFAIELKGIRFSGVSNSVLNFIIGDKVFYKWETCGTDCISILVPQSDFDKLSENAIISVFLGTPVTTDKLEKLYINGEPNDVLGIKFGRLNKKLANQFSIEERTAKP